MSSVFSYIIPSRGSNGYKSNNQKHDIKPVQSLPVRWKSRNFSQKDKPLNKYAECEYKCENEVSTTRLANDVEQSFVMDQTCDDEEAFGTPRGNGDPVFEKSTSSSDIFVDAAGPPSLEKSMPKLTNESSFITFDLYEFFQSSLPNIVKGCEWVLLYR